MASVLIMAMAAAGQVANAQAPTTPAEASLRGLCQAWSSGLGGERGGKLEATAFGRLETLAAERGISVSELCGLDVDEPLRFIGCDGSDPATGEGGSINSPGGSSALDVTIAGGTPPYTLSVVGLDPGFSFAPDGTVTHVSAAPGLYLYTLVVTDAAGDTASTPAGVAYVPGGLPATC